MREKKENLLSELPWQRPRSCAVRVCALRTTWDHDVGLRQSPQSAGQSKYFQLFALGGIHELAPCFEFIMVMYTHWNLFPILFTHAHFTVSCSVDTLQRPVVLKVICRGWRWCSTDVC